MDGGHLELDGCHNSLQTLLPQRRVHPSNHSKHARQGCPKLVQHSDALECEPKM
jgi:hypothetical protein